MILIAVDTERCCGAGMCVLAAPELFDQSEDTGLVELLDASPGPALVDAARQAAATCPSGAITLAEFAPTTPRD